MNIAASIASLVISANGIVQEMPFDILLQG
jgi:hypothetical protein